jgi:hypothetical protein
MGESSQGTDRSGRDGSGVVSLWKQTLAGLIDVYDRRRGALPSFYARLFLFFVILNIVCYWLALLTAFPEYLHGRQGYHYFKIQFPVGLLGALFDSLSFFITVHIVRRAIASRGSLQYVAHLSIDGVIAVLATFWVLFVFIVSGWIVHALTPGLPAYGEEALDNRQVRYGDLLLDALMHPFDNIRNIYFGAIMGVSASLPTCLHVGLFVKSGFLALTSRDDVTTT